MRYRTTRDRAGATVRTLENYPALPWSVDGVDQRTCTKRGGARGARSGCAATCRGGLRYGVVPRRCTTATCPVSAVIAGYAGVGVAVDVGRAVPVVCAAVDSAPPPDRLTAVGRSV